MSADEMILPPARYCPTCERALPIGANPEECAGCAHDRERERQRREREAARRRLGPAPYTRALHRARWGVLALLEDLEAAIEHAPTDADAERLRRALAHAGRARAELGGAT